MELEEVKSAYRRLKSYIYYDNTDILLRRQLVEFETNTDKDFNSILRISPKPYDIQKDAFSQMGVSESVNSKLEKITKHLNEFDETPGFFDYFIDKIEVNFYPKKFKQQKEKGSCDNFVSNKKIQDEYPIERLTPFIDAPIELHIISVLWIMKYGYALDAALSSSCLGNRLVLNKDKKALAHGTGLFKPYFTQYQKWRDESVEVAQNLLENDKEVLFLNLDVKDYFHSVRMENNIIQKDRAMAALSPIEKIFLKLHHAYTRKIINFKVPGNFKDIEKAENDQLLEFILPIGLLSSYVLANHYLKAFDTVITEKYKPAYFGRYVDDILLVITEPNPFSIKRELNTDDLEFSFADYKELIQQKSKTNKSYRVSFKKEDLNKLEEYVLTNLSPLINLVDSPFSKEHKNPEGRVFKLNGYKSLFCQSEKTLLHHFDPQESHLVIDKLKKELEERSSEFRDLPNPNESLGEFENSAYHLHYDGSEGKIRTLKDYKENRFGLTVYLANQIFSALRHERRVSEKEKKQLLQFFKGENCLQFYRLWERIFTFLLVNEEPEAYVSFYVHCLEQIVKVKKDYSKEKIIGTNVSYIRIQGTLVDYLDCANELSISLNPSFIKQTRKAKEHFQFRINALKISEEILSYYFEPTDSQSFWLKRFRETNMVRHQYVVTPLLTYTKKSKTDQINLISPRLDLDTFELDDALLENSPRRVKFSECCIATVFQKISSFDRKKCISNTQYTYTDILNTSTISKNLLTDKDEVNHEFYLEEAFELYQKVNKHHLPHYIWDETYKNNFFQIVNQIDGDEKELRLKEIRINSTNENKLKKPKISFGNTRVSEKNIISGLRRAPNVSINRYQEFASILKKARKENSDIVLFPECFIPINLLSSLTRYSEKNGSLVVTGLEHITKDSTAFNFVVSILPIEVNGIKDATVIFRLKNHYSHSEEHLISGNHLEVPKPQPYRYDLINWRNIYFSVFYCFELANVQHRSILKGKIDLLVCIEYNRDTSYFSNIVESCSRDLHCYIAQVNTSQYGDTRLTQPKETAQKDLLRLKGGVNDAVLVGKIDVPGMREFQRKTYALSHHEKAYKPLPPDFSLKDVLTRIENRDFFGKIEKNGNVSFNS